MPADGWAASRAALRAAHTEYAPALAAVCGGSPWRRELRRSGDRHGVIYAAGGD